VRLTFPVPAMWHGLNLSTELATALSVSPESVDVYVAGSTLIVNVPDHSDEQIVTSTVAAHTGQPTPEQQAELDAQAEAQAQLSQLDAVIAKSRAVIAGTDTFTNAQAQQILARLVLLVARRLR
jgi:hypothetical protein